MSAFGTLGESYDVDLKIEVVWTAGLLELTVDIAKGKAELQNGGRNEGTVRLRSP